MFAIVVQRGRLFLRLYRFTFVVSDADTWRRWLLLALALFACLLPRENPINDIVAAVKRHVDNLVRHHRDLGARRKDRREMHQPMPEKKLVAGGSSSASTKRQKRPQPSFSESIRNAIPMCSAIRRSRPRGLWRCSRRVWYWGGREAC
jgi:hypothetical protein